MKRLKRLPSPLPILANRSLPQMINQTTAPIRSNTMARMIPVMILRFLLTGFLVFFCFLESLGLSLFMV